MKFKPVFVVFFICMLLANFVCFAEIVDKGIENKHTFRFGLRSDEDDYSLYLARISGFIDYRIEPIDKVIKITPFYEYQSNFDTNTWWRKELGAEIGISFFDEVLYYGASLQHVWQKEENYPVELLDETTEWESRLVITPDIGWGIFKEQAKLHIFDEYTYDIKRGQFTFNDVGIGVDFEINEYLTIPISWRHTDRVHDFDADSAEISLLLSF